MLNNFLSMNCFKLHSDLILICSGYFRRRAVMEEFEKRRSSSAHFFCLFSGAFALEEDDDDDNDDGAPALRAPLPDRPTPRRVAPALRMRSLYPSHPCEIRRAFG